MSHHWYDSEYRGERIGLTVVFSVLFIWVLCLCFREYCLGFTTYWYNVCKYNEAKVVPLQVAEITHTPINSIVNTVPTTDVYIVEN